MDISPVRVRNNAWNWVPGVIVGQRRRITPFLTHDRPRIPCGGITPIAWGSTVPDRVREDRVRTFAQDQVLVFGATTFRQFRKFVSEYDEPYYDSLNELELIESTVLDGRTQKLVYIPHLHEQVPEGVGPQRRHAD